VNLNLKAPTTQLGLFLLRSKVRTQKSPLLFGNGHLYENVSFGLNQIQRFYEIIANKREGSSNVIRHRRKVKYHTNSYRNKKEDPV
jgi:hypothetical protein